MYPIKEHLAFSAMTLKTIRIDKNSQVIHIQKKSCNFLSYKEYMLLKTDNALNPKYKIINELIRDS